MCCGGSFPVGDTFAGIGNLDGKGLRKGKLKEKTKGRKCLLSKKWDNVIDRFDQVTRTVKGGG